MSTAPGELADADLVTVRAVSAAESSGTSSQQEEVLGLGPAGTLARIRTERRAQDEAAARELRAVVHWADLHRTEGTVGAVAGDLPMALHGEPVLGHEGLLRLAGEGAFMVEEFAVTEVAAVLGLSEPAARAYVGQAVELRDRLPRLWARVMAGELPAWKGRRIAEETIPLTAAAAAAVDDQLASFAGRMSLRRILRCVQAAIARHDPVEADRRAERAAEGRGVWRDDELDGTSTITAVTDTPAAAALDRSLSEVAGTLRALGDTDPLQVRRAKALGVLADPQHTLDLLTAAENGIPGRSVPRRTADRPVLHVHLHLDALGGCRCGAADLTAPHSDAQVPGQGDRSEHGIGRVDRLGARALAALRRWVGDLPPGARIHLTPVVDLTETVAVDAHEVPDRLRRHIEHRDPSCRFPWCGREGRHDLDHIEPYDPDGPPGQTSTANLARLCRFHHRVKTHGDWSYRRRPDGALHWTSPLGSSYTVDDTGTYPHQ